MSKLIFSMALALVATSAFCAHKPKEATPAGMSPEKMAKLRAARMRHNGGFIIVPGKGHLGVLNAQKKISPSVLTNVIGQIENVPQGRVRVMFADAPFSISTAASEREKSGAAACVFLVDDPNLPISLVSLEEGWGCVNVARLNEDSPTEKKFTARFVKEFVRVSSVVFAGVKSEYRTSPLRSVTSLRQLDRTVGDSYGMDTLIQLVAHLPEIGIMHDQRLTYLEACRRGVAPAPTNDVQKAIWDKVHAMPTAPLTIKPETKKVKD